MLNFEPFSVHFCANVIHVLAMPLHPHGTTTASCREQPHHASDVSLVCSAPRDLERNWAWAESAPASMLDSTLGFGVYSKVR